MSTTTTDLTTQSGRPTRLALDEPAASAARRPDRRGVLLAAGAGLLDRSSRRRNRLQLSRAGAGAVHDHRVAARPCDRRRTRDAQPLPLRRSSRRLPDLDLRHRRQDGAAAARRRIRELDRRGTRPRREALERPIGPNEGPWAEHAMSNLSCTSTERSSTTAPKSLASEIFTHTPPTRRRSSNAGTSPNRRRRA